MKIYVVETNKQLEDAFSVRKEVFVGEQKVPPELEIDEMENESIHFVVYDDSKQPIGAGRLRIVDDYGKVERICILKSYRKKGIGEQLMDEIERVAKTKDLSLLKLNAQTHAEAFYNHLGYQTYSEEFLDAGIPHVAMKKEIGH